MKMGLYGLALAGLFACSLVGCAGGGNNAADNRPIVYAMSNAAAGNSVTAWRLNPNGTLSLIGTFLTGDNGTGTTETPLAGPVDGIDPLASQGSLSLSADQQHLFAINAGSNTVTSFRINGNGTLTVADSEATGGTSPVSVSARGNRVYVVNVNNPGVQASSITGFTLNADGTLTAIAGSTRNLSAANARPSQVSITPDGTRVLVTERGSDTVSSFPINANGTLGNPASTASPRPGPFGFNFVGNNRIVVAELGPVGGISSASSYTLGAAAPAVVTAGLQNGQMASCWVNVGYNGQRAFISNTASHTVTTYGIAADGTLTLRQAAVPTDGAGSAPIDAGVSSTMFVQLLGGKGTIAVYNIGADGNLTLVGVRATGLPTLGSQGLAVRS